MADALKFPDRYLLLLVISNSAEGTQHDAVTVFPLPVYPALIRPDPFMNNERRTPPWRSHLRATRRLGANEPLRRIKRADITASAPHPVSIKGSMPPSIGHMELLAWMQRADFSEHIQGCKSPGDPLNSSHFDAPNTKSAPTGYRRAPNIISHHYKQQLSAKASIVPKVRPIRFP